MRKYTHDVVVRVRIPHRPGQLARFAALAFAALLPTTTATQTPHPRDMAKARDRFRIDPVDPNLAWLTDAASVYGWSPTGEILAVVPSAPRGRVRVASAAEVASRRGADGSNAQAHLDRGVLTLALPRKAGSRPSTIEVNVDGQGS